MRKSSRTLKVLGGLAAAAALIVPSSASAASSASGCFSYGPLRYQNLSTSLEYRGNDGLWYYLGGNGRTNSRGCVGYNLSGSWQNLVVRIRATGVVGQQRAIFDGATPYAGSPGQSSYNLGTGGLRLTIVPAAPSFAGVNTSAWLDQMSTPGAGSGCGSSAAMLVVCYMDAHGLVGNVVVRPRDSDGDGWLDDVDRRKFDPSLR